MAQHTRRDLVAAPPDDGGNLGIFGTPEDHMQVATSRGGDEPERTPTHDDPTRTGTMDKKPPRPGLGVVGGTLLLVAVSAVLVLVAMLVGNA